MALTGAPLTRASPRHWRRVSTRRRSFPGHYPRSKATRLDVFTSQIFALHVSGSPTGSAVHYFHSKLDRSYLCISGPHMIDLECLTWDAQGPSMPQQDTNDLISTRQVYLKHELEIQKQHSKLLQNGPKLENI